MAMEARPCKGRSITRQSRLSRKLGVHRALAFDVDAAVRLEHKVIQKVSMGRRRNLDPVRQAVRLHPVDLQIWQGIPTPLFAIPFPAIDPALIAIGPFAIRRYALAYIFGILLGWLYARALLRSQTPWGGAPR